MAGVRVTTGNYSHAAGDRVGVQVNTFGIDRLHTISGKDLIDIMIAALEPSYQQAYDEWAVLTGASRDSIEIATIEVGDKLARAALQAGGDALRADARNPRGTDYAPYLEFNGSPSGSQAPGTLLRAIFSRDQEIRSIIHSEVAKLIQEKLL